MGRSGEGRKKVKYLQPKEFKKLLGGCEGRYAERNRAVLIFMINTGVRVGEMVGLNIFDLLDPDGDLRDEIILRAEICKRKKERRLSLNGEARRAAKILMDENGIAVICPRAPLLVSGKKGRMSRRQVQRIVEAARRKSGILTAATPHSLRHSLGKMLADLFDLRYTKKVLGHENMSTSEIYAELSDEQVGAAMDGIWEGGAGG